jgi:hypothetical protein
LYRHVWKVSNYDYSNHFPGAVHLEHENANENNKGEKTKSKRNKGGEKGKSKTISNGGFLPNKSLIASVDGHHVGIFPPRHKKFGNIFLQGLEKTKRVRPVGPTRLSRYGRPSLGFWCFLSWPF